jgi:hypothetical protein
MAQLMGGDMGFESQEGVGSTFYFTIVVEKESHPTPMQELDNNYPLWTTSSQWKQYLSECVVLVIEKSMKLSETIKHR